MRRKLCLYLCLHFSLQLGCRTVFMPSNAGFPQTLMRKRVHVCNQDFLAINPLSIANFGQRPSHHQHHHHHHRQHRYHRFLSASRCGRWTSFFIRYTQRRISKLPVLLPRIHTTCFARRPK